MEVRISAEDHRRAMERLRENNPFLPLHGVIRDVLRADIIECTLVPGQQLREVELAEEFGVSRTTIRNALDALAQEGLLEQQGRSMRVAGLTRAQYTQLHEFRRYIDPIAASLAAARHNQSDLERMTACLEATNTDDAEVFLEADNSFHLTICAAAKNQYLLQAYHQIEPARRRINYFSVMSLLRDGLWEFSQHKRERMREEHHSILEAIRRSDDAAAAAMARKHVGLLLFDFDSYEKRFVTK